MKYYDILLIFCLKYEVTMKTKLIESLTVPNTIVNFIHDITNGMYLIQIQDPTTLEVIHTTCYSDYDKAISHLKAYKL